jgi:hypothetical protein
MVIDDRCVSYAGVRHTPYGENRRAQVYGDYPLVVGRESAHDEGRRFAYADS